ncbi:Uncharacterized protein DAT39_014441, partial [Clarias magur]
VKHERWRVHVKDMERTQKSYCHESNTKMESARKDMERTQTYVMSQTRRWRVHEKTWKERRRMS